MPIKEYMKVLNSKIQGHINYYAIYGNMRSVKNFVNEVRTLLNRWLNRRSQRKSFNWAGYIKFLAKYPLPKVRMKVKIHELGAGANYLRLIME
jgi:hypothetical protein